jgi:Na+-transporting methylmalonyl-CoA/oxaloacetate decarboxylase gamma subunit
LNNEWADDTLFAITSNEKSGHIIMDTIHVFIAGITGVFLGMSLLYLSIKVTSLIVNNFFDKKTVK